ncbi:hypothetical protein MS3_00003667 [Schistosoma haematobium]|uniref:Elongator complex protein 5 n=1 Tax=Schistosoma haematobium TaxID=6185 RepID=A0A095BW06_SCHHA|nr:hypothetical protein MS3_00003667 [Schistosoma haematobium]KAH9591363.1 hypothetical protein MS3_00003667 [Schistosoma haematobium]CAH8668866.1 unnamed protein product [Schistosoma haematobium]CAH8674674.1 unnamed protein product [Schistosoma haematobium]
MVKQRCLDLLFNKIPSNFIAYIDECHMPRNNNNWLWKCLINENCEKYTCILVTSELYNYKTVENSHQSLKVLHTYNYETSESLVNKLSKLSCSVRKRNDQQTFIFIESLSWFLIDCPIDYEFDYWCQFVIGSLFNLSLTPYVQRVVCNFNPVIDNSSKVYYGASSTIIDTLEAYATSVIYCQSLTEISNSLTNQICQSLKLFHRRSLQGECNKCLENSVSFNKSSFTECGTIELDTKALKILKYSINKNEPDSLPVPSPLPKSTFNLTMTESEKIARSFVVLPHDAVRLSNTVEKSESPGCVIQYQPDCFDDLDDEDPDDDLHI